MAMFNPEFDGANVIAPPEILVSSGLPSITLPYTFCLPSSNIFRVLPFPINPSKLKDMEDLSPVTLFGVPLPYNYSTL